MSGVLYIVATPIGNLDDISLRAIATLKAVDLIAAEDTRHSKRLLNHLGVTTRMISCHDHNEVERSAELLLMLGEGKDIALISDAGTPLISDPGYGLVSRTQQAGFKVSPIPGACSIITALCAAGLPTDRFHYLGFLSQKNSERLVRLKAIKQLDGSLVLLESCHRIERLMEQLNVDFAENQVVIAKELTKLHERYLRGTPAELVAILRADEVLKKGEFVVLIDNRLEKNDSLIDPEDENLLRCLLEELPLKKAVKVAIQLTGKKKNDLYQLALDIQNASAEARD